MLDNMITMVDEKQKLERMKKAIGRITEKAREDNIITEEEKLILDSVKEAVERYEEALEKALEDNIITPEEKAMLADLEERIYSEAYFSAMDDGVLDKDELLLLKTLLKSIHSGASTAWLEEDLEK
jgi:hypothetical protein